ncbi:MULTISPECIES: hypothetical protein [Paraburkholderia]|uniref:hypothetical protein n=1 Tax=Paraburkholderia TaxID=1822464 RepID=UPI0032184927
MLDAEIAVKLLNRLLLSSGAVGSQYLEMLREGRLNFSHQIGRVMVDDLSNAYPFDIEMLIFSDGSRALRICTEACPRRWTDWVALAPASSETRSNEMSRKSDLEAARFLQSY